MAEKVTMGFTDSSETALIVLGGLARRFPSAAFELVLGSMGDGALRFLLTQTNSVNPGVDARILAFVHGVLVGRGESV